MRNVDERLNEALERLTSDDFLSGKGLGNEIAFYVFDYSPEDEPRVRERVPSLVASAALRRPDVRVRHVDLLRLTADYLSQRGLLEKALQLQRSKGDAALLKSLSGPLRADRMAQEFARAAEPEQHDVILATGVGAVYPMLRTHGLLNNLQSLMRSKPLVLFFPGHYDGQQLRLFDLLRDENYYRAFRLVP